MAILLRMLLLACLLVSPVRAASPAPDHAQSDFDALLRAHVHWNATGTSTTVDYAGFKRDRARLRAYLAAAARIDAHEFAAWPQRRRQAFLINVYNAATVDLVLSRYPDLDSIKALGGLFSSPWKQPLVPLLGKVRSLDEIEHGLLRGASDYRDVRIHFAVNCASVGCPALRPEAYVDERLDAQLDDQTRRFLRDRSRNVYDAGDGVLRVSKIFDWYAGDFDRLEGGVAAFLARHGSDLGLDDATTRRLAARQLPVDFGKYDWSLNRSNP